MVRGGVPGQVSRCSAAFEKLETSPRAVLLWKLMPGAVVQHLQQSRILMRALEVSATGSK
jgi:hypothetical protein